MPVLNDLTLSIFVILIQHFLHGTCDIVYVCFSGDRQEHTG